MDKYIETPLQKNVIKELKSGDYVYITGTVYTARDAAHKRMYEALQEEKPLPVSVEGQIIYYMGRLLQEKEGQPVLPVRQQRDVWTNIRRVC